MHLYSILLYSLSRPNCRRQGNQQLFRLCNIFPVCYFKVLCFKLAARRTSGLQLNIQVQLFFFQKKRLQSLGFNSGPDTPPLRLLGASGLKFHLVGSDWFVELSSLRQNLSLLHSIGSQRASVRSVVRAMWSEMSA